MIIGNLKLNQSLLSRLVTGEMDAEALAEMSSEVPFLIQYINGVVAILNLQSQSILGHDDRCFEEKV